MKKSLFLVLALVALLSACKDDELVKTSPAIPGDEIQFGTTTYVAPEFHDADNNAPGTRTVYSGLNGDRTAMKLNWVSGDEIGIYCPEASQPLPYKEVDYVITPNQSDPSSGTMLKADINEIGLQWGNGDEHNFYGIYPASAVQEVVDRNTIKCNLPLLQTPKEIIEGEITDKNGTTRKAYIAMPNMNYAYMWAHETVYRLQQGNDPIPLHFTPLVTALEIKVNGPSDDSKYPDGLQVSQIVVQSTNALCGDFDMKISSGDVEPHNNGELNTMITIPVADANNNPVTLKKDEVLVVIAFLLPTQSQQLGNTYVTVYIPGKGSRTKILNKDVISAQLYNMTSLPALVPNTGASFWMTTLDQRVYFSQLSIPGGHNCYSIDANATGSNTLMTAYQTKTIEEQFDLGARAFSFMVGLEQVTQNMGLIAGDKASWNPGGNDNYELYLYNGQTKTETTLSEVLESYRTMLESKKKQYSDQLEAGVEKVRDAKDFIVLNINYKASMGTGQKMPDEKDENFTKRQQLTWLKNVSRIVNAFGSSYPDLVVTDLSPETALYHLKGKIVILVNNLAESFSYTGERFKNLAYSFTTNDYTYSSSNDALYYTVTTGPKDQNGANYTLPSNDRDFVDLYYVQPQNQKLGASSTLRFWRQHLERLSPPSGVALGGNYGTLYANRTTDKVQLAQQLISWAVKNNKTDGNTGNWFFNDLGGFSTVNTEKSYHEDYGESGNTVDAAARVNGPMFDFLSDSENNAAPCGIVLMNFLGTEELTNNGTTVTVRGSSLPQLIIENNLRFQLKINPNVPQEED